MSDEAQVAGRFGLTASIRAYTMPAVDRPLPIRLEDDTIERLDRLAAALTERAAGVKVSRSGAMRATIERGLDVLEAELGIGRTKRRPPRR